MERRKFLLYGATGLGFLGGIGVIVDVIVRFLWPPAEIVSKEKGGGNVVFNLEDIPPGTARKFSYKGQPYIVIRTEKTIVALSAVCTHLGCLVNFESDSGTLLCPCHGARFDIQGRVLGGPAPRPLASAPVRVEGNKIIVGEA